MYANIIEKKKKRIAYSECTWIEPPTRGQCRLSYFDVPVFLSLPLHTWDWVTYLAQLNVMHFLGNPTSCYKPWNNLSFDAPANGKCPIDLIMIPNSSPSGLFRMTRWLLRLVSTHIQTGVIVYPSLYGYHCKVTKTEWTTERKWHIADFTRLAQLGQV